MKAVNIVEIPISLGMLTYERIPEPLKGKVDLFLEECKKNKTGRFIGGGIWQNYDSFYCKHYAGCVLVYGNVNYKDTELLKIFTYSLERPQPKWEKNDDMDNLVDDIAKKLDPVPKVIAWGDPLDEVNE